MPERDRNRAKPPQFDIPRVPGFDDAKQPAISYTMRFPCYIDHAVVGFDGPGPFPLCPSLLVVAGRHPE